jgi:alpha-galactosidase
MARKREADLFPKMSTDHLEKCASDMSNLGRLRHRPLIADCGSFIPKSAACQRTIETSKKEVRSSSFRSALWVAALLLFATIPSLPSGTQSKASSAVLAATPPMGWANWNSLGCNYDETTIRNMADHMVSSGMKEAGYQYLIIQECIVPSGHRDDDSTLIPDPHKFPHGIPALVEYIHQRGLKAGIYTDVGPQTCADYEGSFEHEMKDAQTFASWGIDLIEEDFCHKPAGFRAEQLYARMRDAIAHTRRPMFFYICNWGSEMAWTWAPKLGNAWRSTGDVLDPGHADWIRMLRNFDQNALHASSGGPNHWSDPDMLEVGVPGINAVEERSVFSLWAISAAPLWAGNDLTIMSEETQQILTNSEVIAVDQDPFGEPGTLVAEDTPGLQVWARPLVGQGSPQAVLLINRTSESSEIHVRWEDLGIYGSAEARDLWSHQNLGVIPHEYSAHVPTHGVVMLRVVPRTTK